MLLTERPNMADDSSKAHKDEKQTNHNNITSAPATTPVNGGAAAEVDGNHGITTGSGSSSSSSNLSANSPPPYGSVELGGGMEGKSGSGVTPSNTAAEASSSYRQLTAKNSAVAAAARVQVAPATAPTAYGQPILVNAQGNFPEVGSILGPYFCLGRLGKGTFSSIHKCINMQYFHQQHRIKEENLTGGNDRGCQPALMGSRRVAAAKVELVDFQQSGVLASEATILDFLHRSLPPGTVPMYMGHYKSSQFAAILMEYLPGEDMHQLREQVMSGSNTRRIATEDAVYLTAEVMLPLLQRFHAVGMVHRDVKPSNCVRTRTDSKEFCLVDFGLSKSIIVPEESEYADTQYLWTSGADWLKPLNCKSRGAYRKERKKAEFRGTSMYASLRVHQEKDYCPRDDMWSLMYVFCDLVSGGLPWMQHAASRDRAGCQAVKERVHGEAGNPQDETASLLMGDIYHVAAYRKERQEAAAMAAAVVGGGDVNSAQKRTTVLPEPLAMSKDERKVNLLRKAFQHLAQLRFYDMPDYGLIRECIRGFLERSEGQAEDPPIKSIQWVKKPDSPNLNPGNLGYPKWALCNSVEADPLEESIFDDPQAELDLQSRSTNMTGRLPVEFQFRLAQMKYNAIAATCPSRYALCEWMQVALPLLYKEWDARNYEDGGHRTSTDGFRRERYLKLLQECQKCAQQHNNFQSRDCFYDVGFGTSNGHGEPRAAKRQKIEVHFVSDADRRSPMVFLSRTLYYLDRAIQAEKAKKPPPPMRISFS